MDHLLSKDYLENPGPRAPTGTLPPGLGPGREGRIGPVPRPGSAAYAGSPRGFTQHHEHDRPIDRWPGSAGSGSRPDFVPPPRPLGAGRGRRRDGLAPWPAASRGRAGEPRPRPRGRRSSGGPRRVLSDNSVVRSRKQATRQVAVVVAAIEVSPRTVDPYGCAGAARREVGAARTGDRYPRAGRPTRRETPRPSAESRGRDRRAASASAAVGTARRPDRRGQAPKGTGGMPRRHQQYGRGRLRKVRGSCPTSVDPGMPEETRGTETSQYPEEKKATETPSVAASERGPA